MVGVSMRRWVKVSTAMLILLLLCGCAWLHTRALSPIPAVRRHVILLAPAPLAVVGGQRYSGADQKQDYLLLRNSHAQAELIYIRAIGYQGDAAIRYHGDRLRQFTTGWAINAAGIYNWGAHTLRTPMAQFHYVRYSTGQAPRHCAAYQALWDVPPGDICGRPGQLIFGYYCARRGVPLKKVRLTRFLSSLRIGFYSGAKSQAESIPLLAAQRAENKTGYRPFPRLLPVFRRPLFDIR